VVGVYMCVCVVECSMVEYTKLAEGMLIVKKD